MCIITDLISPEMRLDRRTSVLCLQLNSEVGMILYVYDTYTLWHTDLWEEFNCSVSHKYKLVISAVFNF